MQIKHLRTSDKAVTAIALRQTTIGAAVEFSGRANAGFTGG